MQVYFDTAYIAKCYLNEPHADIVRQLAQTANGLASCEIARVEFYSVLHRHLREGNITARESREVLKDFHKDEKDGVWTWLPVTSALIHNVCERIESLPKTTLLRAADAIHLGCANLNGFVDIYSNDRHLLNSAQHFGLKGINLINP